MGPVHSSRNCDVENQQVEIPLTTADNSIDQTNTSCSIGQRLAIWIRKHIKKICVVGLVLLLLVGIGIVIHVKNKDEMNPTATITTIARAHQDDKIIGGISLTTMPHSSKPSSKPTTGGQTSTTPKSDDHSNTTSTKPPQLVCETDVKRTVKYNHDDYLDCENDVQEEIRNASCLFLDGSCNSCNEIMRKNLAHYTNRILCCLRRAFCNMSNYCQEGQLECKDFNPTPFCVKCRPGFNGDKCQSKLPLATVKCQCHQTGFVNASSELCTNTYLGGKEQQCRLGNCSCDLSKEIQSGTYERCDGTA